MSLVSIIMSASEFVGAHCSVVLKLGLEEQLISHLTNMWFEGVIGRDCMLKCMDLYNEYTGHSRSYPIARVEI